MTEAVRQYWLLQYDNLTKEREAVAAILKDSFGVEVSGTPAGVAAGPKRKRKRKPRDPDKPKRPATAYILWATANRDRIKTENGNEIKGRDMMKLLGHTWTGMDSEAKADWERKAKKKRKEYDVEMSAYQAKSKDASDGGGESANAMSTPIAPAKGAAAVNEDGDDEGEEEGEGGDESAATRAAEDEDAASARKKEKRRRKKEKKEKSAKKKKKKRKSQ